MTSDSPTWESRQCVPIKPHCHYMITHSAAFALALSHPAVTPVGYFLSSSWVVRAIHVLTRCFHGSSVLPSRRHRLCQCGISTKVRAHTSHCGRHGTDQLCLPRDRASCTSGVAGAGARAGMGVVGAAAEATTAPTPPHPMPRVSAIPPISAAPGAGWRVWRVADQPWVKRTGGTP
jgi:hypothetical protein